MRLSILVPRYKEPWDTCKSLFDSIALQRGIDFNEIEAIVVNDGDEDILPEDVFKPYPFKVTYKVESHGGVSATRNKALDMANGEYVMFCDIDDMFLNNCGLNLIFKSTQSNPDMIISSFIEENGQTGSDYKMVRHDKNLTFVHGKVYRKAYLIDKEIRFRDDLTIHEDGYFNYIASVCADTKQEITTPIYLWKWNAESTVRVDPENYVLKTYDHLMRCRKAICEELYSRGYISEYIDAVCKTVIDSYYDFNKTAYIDPKNSKEVRIAERAFKKFYEQFGQDYREANITRIAELMAISRTLAFANGLRVEQKTLNEWLTHIVSEV